MLTDVPTDDSRNNFLTKTNQTGWFERPPCTAYCILNFGMNDPKLDPDVVDEKLRAAKVHIGF